MFISIKNIESTCEMVFLGFNNNNLRFKLDLLSKVDRFKRVMGL